MSDNYDYSNSYWRSCQFRFNRRKDKLTLECQLKNDIKLMRFTDETVIAYYILHNNNLIGSISGYMADNNSAFYISISIINPEHCNKGFGTILYKHIINKYKTVYSDHERTQTANYMWEKIKKIYNNVKYENSRFCVSI